MANRTCLSREVSKLEWLVKKRKQRLRHTVSRRHIKLSPRETIDIRPGIKAMDDPEAVTGIGRQSVESIRCGGLENLALGTGESALEQPSQSRSRGESVTPGSP